MFAGNSETTQRIDWRIPAAWLTLCIVWSSTWLAIKVGLRDLPPISYVAIRFLIAIVALIAVSVGHTRLRPKRRSDYGVLAFTGVLMFAINYVLLFWGELYVSSGLAAILQASIPIFGMVFALAFAGGTVALAAPAWRVRVDRRGRANLRSSAQFQWLARISGWPRNHHRCCQRGVFQCVAKIAADGSRPSDDGSVANDFRHRPTAGDRIYRRWQPSTFSLDRNGNFLPPLSRDHRIVAHLFASLLANAAHVGDETANYLADHATRRDRTRLGSRWRTIVGLVAPRCLFRRCRGLDYFPTTRR